MIEVWEVLEDLNGEIWKVIEEFEDYSVSNYGRIKSFKQDKINGKILKPFRDRKGYRRVELNSKTKSVHRLILETFNPIDNMNNLQVNHINGIKDDNIYPDNLEWCTNSENQKHAFKIGLENNQGENHPQSKLTNGVALEIKKISMTEDYKNFKIKQKDIAEMFKLSIYIISKILRGEAWTHVKLEGWIPEKTSNSGERNGASKLTNRKVIQIKMLIKLGFKSKDIAEIFGVSYAMISNIKSGRNWSHIKVEEIGLI